MNIIEIRENIIKFLEQSDLTQSEIADVIGVDQSRVNLVMSRKKSNCFTLEQVTKLADHFNVSIDSLIGHHVESKEEKTLAAAAKAILYIDEICGIHIDDNGAISLECSFMDTMISQLKAIKAAAATMRTTSEQNALIATWEKGMLANMERCPISMYSNKNMLNTKLKLFAFTGYLKRISYRSPQIEDIEYVANDDYYRNDLESLLILVGDRIAKKDKAFFNSIIPDDERFSDWNEKAEYLKTFINLARASKIVNPSEQ